jgi:protein SCO1/2
MGAYSADFTQHPLMVLVGDGRTDTWTRFSGTPDPQRLAAHIQGLRQARVASADTAAGRK